MLYNGFGEHNIQGIGDKHIPLIHNVYNTDVVTAVSDQATDHLSVLFSSPAGLAYLAERRNVPQEVLEALSSFGLSSICNIVAAVKTAKYLDLGPGDVVATVATDGAEMYGSERTKILARDFPGPASMPLTPVRRSGAGCWRREPTTLSRPPSGTASGYSTSATSPG
jgi:cysteine synthase A